MVFITIVTGVYKPTYNWGGGGGIVSNVGFKKHTSEGFHK